MPETEIIPINDAPETAPTETAKEKFERERLSRRQALKKFGMTSAMATFALFSVDDLAHMVGKAMQQRARDNKVATQIAKEFQQAGIAFAGGGSGTPCNQWETPAIRDPSQCASCNQTMYTQCLTTPGETQQSCTNRLSCANVDCHPNLYNAWLNCWGL